MYLKNRKCRHRQHPNPSHVFHHSQAYSHCLRQHRTKAGCHAKAWLLWGVLYSFDDPAGLCFLSGLSVWCWALFIFSAVAESIRSILHTIFKIIQDRQHNSYSIRIQMAPDGGTTHLKTNTADFQCWERLSYDHLPHSHRLHFSRKYTCREFFTSARYGVLVF